MPCTSVIDVTRRLPSRRRVIWMIRSTALQICSRMARSGRSMPAISTMVSRRASASRGVLAWMVVSEPSWPVFMAWSMSSASPPRHSPTMMRSGRIRRAFLTRSRMRDLALALDVRRTRLQAHHVVLLELQLGGVLDGDDALVVGDEARQHVQQRRLAGTGAAGDDDVQPGSDTGVEELCDLGSQRLLLDQVVDRQGVLGELADGERRAARRPAAG